MARNTTNMREWTFIAFNNYALEIGEKARAGHEVCKPLLDLWHTWLADTSNERAAEALERKAFQWVQIKRMGFE